MNELFFILFQFAARASATVHTLAVAVGDMSCELEELFYHLLLKVKALSPPRELPSRYMALRHLTIRRPLTLAIEALVWDHSRSYNVAAQYILPSRQLPGHGRRPSPAFLILSMPGSCWEMTAAAT